MTDPIRDAVRQWLAKAQSDLTTIEILTASGRAPTDTVAFHCQQFVEKILKAVLTHAGIEAPKTHDLRRLIELAAPSVPELSSLVDIADTLTVYGVDARYPGSWIQVSPDEMAQAVERAERFATLIIPRLELWIGDQ